MFTFYLLHVYVFGHTGQCGGRRLCGSWLSPSTTEAPGTELRVSGLGANNLTLCIILPVQDFLKKI